jgi:hypothetical protein
MFYLLTFVWADDYAAESLGIFTTRELAINEARLHWYMCLQAAQQPIPIDLEDCLQELTPTFRDLETDYGTYYLDTFVLNKSYVMEAMIADRVLN